MRFDGSTTDRLLLLGTFAMEEVAQSSVVTTNGFSASTEPVDNAWTSVFGLYFKGSTLFGAGNRLTEANIRTHGSMTSTLAPVGASSALVFPQVGFEGATVTPAALSVQITNAQSVQGTNGLLYACRLNTQFTWDRGSATSVSEFADAVIAYNSPRVMPAAKLAFRGVKIDAVPYNMSQLADFKPVLSYYEKDDTGADLYFAPVSLKSTGFAPIFLYIPGSSSPDPLSLQLLVATEWRLRFDPLNPAQAAHVSHPAVADSIWDRLQSAMRSQGHGVFDIVEQVANWGARAAGVVSTVRRARAIAGGAPMLALGA
jgi:hypothetical protein